MNLSEAIPFNNTSADPADDIEGHIAVEPMRGMDVYQLTGNLSAKSVKRLRQIDYYVDKSSERAFLFHTGTPTVLNDIPNPNPTSNTPALDAKVQERFAFPLWERGYLIKGRISIDGDGQYLYVNGRFFPQATRGRKIPDHDTHLYARARYRSMFGKRIVLDQALWLNHPFSQVYFHTFNDVMTQLVLADRLGISNATTIVVDHHWAQLPHGQHFLDSDLLRGRDVVVLGPDETVVCKSLYMLQPQLYSRPLLDQVAASFPEQKPQKAHSDRLVLIRDQATNLSRVCDGMPELVDALVAQGYSAWDPATLTIPEQKWVFSRARHIVAENGSALTNIIFRGGKPLRIDALMASKFPSITFQCLSKVYRYQYHAHVLPSVRHPHVWPSTRTGKHVQSTLTRDVMDFVLMQANRIQEESE